MFVYVGDADAHIEMLRIDGVKVVQPPADKPWESAWGLGPRWQPRLDCDGQDGSARWQRMPLAPPR